MQWGLVLGNMGESDEYRPYAIEGGPVNKFPLDQFVDVLVKIWPTASFPEDYVLLNDLDHLRDLRMSDRRRWLKRGKRAALRRVLQERLDEFAEVIEEEVDQAYIEGLLEAFSEDLNLYTAISEREKKVWLSKARVLTGKRFDLESVVYFVGCDQFVKIGYTTKLSSRLSSLQTASPNSLQVHLVLPGTREDERDFHTRFEGLREGGEWFRLEGELLRYIKSRKEAQLII